MGQMVVAPRQAYVDHRPSSSLLEGRGLFLCKFERSIVMQRIGTHEVRAYVGERVLVKGWLQSLRQMGGINFLVLRDGWGTLQAVAETETEIAPLVESAAGIESVIAIEGDVVEMPQAPGGIELHNLRIEVITPVSEVLPVSLNKRKIAANLTTLLDHAAVTNRNPQRRAMLRIGAGVMAGFRTVLTARAFTEIQ